MDAGLAARCAELVVDRANRFAEHPGDLGIGVAIGEQANRVGLGCAQADPPPGVSTQRRIEQRREMTIDEPVDAPVLGRREGTSSAGLIEAQQPESHASMTNGRGEHRRGAEAVEDRFERAEVAVAAHPVEADGAGRRPDLTKHRVVVGQRSCGDGASLVVRVGPNDHGHVLGFPLVDEARIGSRRAELVGEMIDPQAKHLGGVVEMEQHVRSPIPIPSIGVDGVGAVELAASERVLRGRRGGMGGEPVEQRGARRGGGRLDLHGERLGDFRHRLATVPVRTVIGMYTFIELWTPNDTWKALSAEERSAFMEGVGGAMEQMTAAGITTLGWGAVDDDTPYATDRQYVAVWQAPSKEAIETLEQGVQGSGWYDYFDQVNARAELAGPEVVIGEHISM